MLTTLADLGNALGGLAAVVLALAAIVGGSAGLSDWRQKQNAQKNLADEEAYNIQLDRQRLMNGWTEGMVNVYGVELVTDLDAMNQARDELIANEGSEYVILKVSEKAAGNENRAHFLRQLIMKGRIARPPERGELDALRRGLTYQHLSGEWNNPQNQ